MGVKMNFRIMTKSHVADPEIKPLKNGFQRPFSANGHADNVEVKLIIFNLGTASRVIFRQSLTAVPRLII